MRFVLLLVFLFVTFSCFAQSGYTDWWHFGKKAGVHFTATGPEAFYDSQMPAIEGCASISDSLGNLLFYTNGQYIWNKNNELMPHGDSLLGTPTYGPLNQAWIDTFGNTSTNGVLILPKPGASNLYYVFSHVGACFTLDCKNAIVYSIVDMTKQGNLGDVVQRNVYLDSAQHKLTEKLAACRHANGRDWWLIIHEYQSNKFLKWLVTPTTINGPTEQGIGGDHIGNVAQQGEITISKQGDRLALATVHGVVHTFTFDRCTSALSDYIPLSNPVNISVPSADKLFYGCAFSPDGQMLYASAGDSIYQWDLTDTSNIVKLGVVANPKPWLNTNTDTSYTGAQMELGPDDKLYFRFFYSWSNFFDVVNTDATSLSVIHQPDLFGLACNPELNAVSHYPRLSLLGLPNMPNYNLGALVGSGCDTLSSVDISHQPGSDFDFSLHPNPGFDQFTCTYNLPLSHQAVIEVRDLLGRVVFSVAAQKNSTRVSTKALPDGLYHVRLVSSGETLGSAKWMKTQ